MQPAELLEEEGSGLKAWQLRPLVLVYEPSAGML